MNTKVKVIGVGLSGGTDSAAAALLLKEAGYDVIAYTMVHLEDGGKMAEKASAVAEKLRIQHRIVDVQAEFKRDVLEPIVDIYANGKTPSPCVLCNQRIKFGVLQQKILSDGCDAMATGHYALLSQDENGSLQLRRGLDSKKDQSYFLAQLTVDQLSKAVFPLGDKLKADMKAWIQSKQIVPPSEGESQDLCFVPNGQLGEFLSAQRPSLQKDGWMIDTNGKRLGRHHGACHYTPGQRRGLGLGGGPWFVLRTDAAANHVIIGHQEELGVHDMTVASLNWLHDCVFPFECSVQVRYLMRPRRAVVASGLNGQVHVHFHEPVDVAPPGQLAVFYDGDRVLGSGWIL